MNQTLKRWAHGLLLAACATAAAAQRPESSPTAAPSAESRPAPASAAALLKEADEASKAWRTMTCKASYSYLVFGRKGAGEAELSMVAERVDRRRRVRVRADGALAAPDGRKFSGVVEDDGFGAPAFVVVDVAARTFERREPQSGTGKVTIEQTGARVYDVEQMLASTVFQRIKVAGAPGDVVESKLAGTETIGGVLCDVLEIEVSSSQTWKVNGVEEVNRSVRRERFAFGRQDRFVRLAHKTVRGDKDAEPKREERLELIDVRIGAPVAAERFVLSVEGMQEAPFGGK